MKYIKNMLASSIIGVFILLFSTGIAFAATLNLTDFESFTTGISVDGQGGWSSASKWDEDIVDYAGNKVWRVSNSVFSTSFGDMPFAPRLGGIVTDSVTNPVNSLPQYFAGESSTGAGNAEFFGKFNFKSSTGAPQPGLRITVSADNGQGGRQSFFAIEDNGSTGLNVTTFDVLSDGSFDDVSVIATGLSYTDWHSVGVDLKFVDGLSNDVVRYFVNDSLVHTNTSWEQYYRNYQSTLHPLGVPVQTLLFRISSGASGVAGNGFYIDNVQTGIGLFSSGPESKNDCKDDGWSTFSNPTFKNQGDCVSFVQSNPKAIGNKNK
ncbi:MAG: hypothetical protein WA152_01675 [Microgenomates group bacterium]